MIDAQELTVEPGTTSGTYRVYESPHVTEGTWSTEVFETLYSSAVAAALSDAIPLRLSEPESVSPTRKETALVGGSLPGGYRLTLAIPVELWREGEEVVAAQPALRLHSFGSDRDLAIANFPEVLVEQLERLEGYENRLSSPMEEDLKLLRALVRRDG